MVDHWPSELDAALPGHLAAQRWYPGGEPPPAEQVRVQEAELIWAEEGRPALWHLLVRVGPEGPEGGAGPGPEQAGEGDCYQLLVGMRPEGDRAEFLHGHDGAVIGSAEGVYAYDAVWDTELDRALLEIISGGEERAERARSINAEQSNSSIVFDDRLILKIFRRLRPGPNPDVEVTTALAGAGFPHVARPVVHWRKDRYDLAFGQQFLAGGTEGWALALTSLRDLYSSPDPERPADAGGDFAAEAARLGRVTAEMHAALHGVFGPAGADAARGGWAALVLGLPERLGEAGRRAGRDLLEPSQPLLDRLRRIDDPGPMFRVHGDFHLGQVMRTDLGWYVLDFEGEPLKSVELRAAPASPLKDVTGMLRSFHYASRYALVEQAFAQWGQMEPAARAWEAHNRQAFLEGYRGYPGAFELLPDAAVAPAVLIAYELDKALYELDYELSHRPEWVSIPLDALEGLVEGGGNG